VADLKPGGFGEQFAHEVVHRFSGFSLVNIPFSMRSAMAGRGSTVSTFLGGGGSDPGSYDVVIGERAGRYWEISPVTPARSSHWFVGSKPTLRVSTWFRAAAPGQERARDTPWFLLGPEPSMMGGSPGDLEERFTRDWAKDRMGAKLGTVRIDGVRGLVTAAASHPPLDASIRSPLWLDWYRPAYALAGPGLGGPAAPMLVGRNNWMSLCVGVNARQNPAAYADLVGSFLAQSDRVEEGFEAPLPSQTPFAWKWDEVAPGFKWPLPEPMFTCPACGNLEHAAHFTNRRYAWKQLLISGKCHQFLYRDAPPGVVPDVAAQKH